MHRALHPRSMGYVDLAQFQTLSPGSRMEHAQFGRLEGFTEIRRATAVVMGPDSAATTRWGLEGSYQTGGWTSDLYLVSPPELNRQQSSWSAGLAGSSQDLSLYGAAGFHHASRTQWRGPAGYIDGPVSNGGWGFLRWKRGGLRALVDADGIQNGRLAWLPDPEAFRPQVRWFWPQVEGSLGWVRSDANPWSEGDAVAGDLRVPILDDRVMVRLDAGGDGFHFLQVGSSIDPQGMVGLDLTWAVRDDQAYPGARLRLPVFTLSVNDPDEWYAHGNSNRLVWSLRFVMTWEDGQTMYAPGRRPIPGEPSP